MFDANSEQGRPFPLSRTSMLIIAVFFGIRLFAAPGDGDARIPVEFWHAGDDVLSQKLAKAVEKALKRSPDFRLTPISPGRKLVVCVMSNVEWEMASKKTKAKYTVQFLWLNETSEVPEVEHRYERAKEISEQTGSCWDRELQLCAVQILRDAKIAALKMPQ